MEAKPVIWSFDTMIASLRRAMGTFPDKRSGKNIRYEIEDAAASAFSVFFTQSPSFLAYQELMQQKYGLSNAKTLFHIGDIPSDNQIRVLLDTVNPSLLSSVFSDCLQAVKSSGDIAPYRVDLGKKKNDLLIALDGTEYHTSAILNMMNSSHKRTQAAHSAHR